MDREYVSVEVGATLVGLSAWTLRQYLTQNKLKRYKVGSRTLVDKAEVLGLVHAETRAEQTARSVARESRRAKAKR